MAQHAVRLLPTDADLERVLVNGLYGTYMPSWNAIGTRSGSTSSPISRHSRRALRPKSPKTEKKEKKTKKEKEKETAGKNPT